MADWALKTKLLPHTNEYPWGTTPQPQGCVQHPTAQPTFSAPGCKKHEPEEQGSRKNGENSKLTADFINVSPSPIRNCGLQDQTAKHTLQRCPLLQTATTNMWPSAVHLHTKLYGGREELEKTATLILQIGLPE